MLNIMTYNIPFAFILTFGGIYAEEYFHYTVSAATLLFSAFFATSMLGRLALSLRPPHRGLPG
ncbi:hypothetical protein [Thermogymnomonas acidicola]|uniref:hypothetical protein n=1 Tax=Thermogymnomonas acidicola TaxID=399579 RepID=UPI001396ADB8|nr:hypothetical protein [Thermogymnomonas acidicola]